MKKCNIRKILPIALLSVAIFVLPMLIAALLIRNLGSIIAIFLQSDENAKFDFALIFEQLRDAKLSLHWLLPLIFSVMLFCILFLALRKGKSKLMAVIISIFAFIILFLFAIVSSLMLTSVNGIRFCDLLSKLIPIIDKL